MHSRSIPGLFFLLVILINPTLSLGDKQLTAHKVLTAPVIDGKASDIAWSNAGGITTHDAIADIDIQLKAVYTGENIFFLVQYPDKDESRSHRSWLWNKDKNKYDQGFDREDVFVFKWNLENHPVDLSLSGVDEYQADIWFWKAFRTDSVGYADDKKQQLSFVPTKKAKEISTRTGKTMYLLRLGDKGDPAYKTEIYIEHKGIVVPRFSFRTPTGSRADIAAKGEWSENRWTIEFARKMITGNDDDIQLQPEKSYLFGVSRYEIAGRPEEPEAMQPKYGSGDVGEKLILTFGH